MARLHWVKTRVVPDIYLAGYPAARYPANNFTGYPVWPDTGYPAGYLAK